MQQTKQSCVIYIIASNQKKHPFACDICGRYDISPSVIELTCGFSSKHTSENSALIICGECADRVFDVFKNYGGYKK